MRSLILGGLMVTLCRLASAQTQPLSAQDILKRVDAKAEGIKDQIAQMEMVVEDVGHEPRRLSMQVHMRGAQRRVNFLSPGDVKGLRVLTLSHDQTYVYLPQFRKVRRVASHSREQSMFGIDYNFEDAATSTLGDVYNAVLLSQNDKQWTLKLTPKAADESPYSMVEVDVLKANDEVAELRYFGKDGTKSKTEQRSDYTCQANACMARKTKMINHAKDDHWTEVNIRNMQLNTNFPDHVFSLRDLQRNE